ncbi:Uncharacterised protein [Klebsiella pneumoniae]|nr:Uncharacterised protein [Klebsiella pneumoniae]
MVVFTLILQSEVQTVNQTEEIGVTVGCDAVGTTGHVVVGIVPAVTAPFNQHIGCRFDVVDRAVVTAIVE